MVIKKKFLLTLPFGIFLLGCMPPPKKIKPPQSSLASRIDQILENKNLSKEQKKKLILNLFARKRKEWSAQNIYTKERAKKLAELLSMPATPIHTPPKIMRVLILPWVDKNGVFHGSHYVFMQVDSGKWVLGTYKVGELEEQSKLLTPLSGRQK